MNTSVLQTSMPALSDGGGERPGCLPGSKDEPFLPSISRSVRSDYNSESSSDNSRRVSPTRPKLYHNSSSSSCSHNNNNNNSLNDSFMNSTGHSQATNGTYNDGKKKYSSAPASESSTPFKLPNIDRSKSNSVTSLASERYGHKMSRGRSRDRRSKLNRSPSCPSNLGYWYDEQEAEVPATPDTARVPSDTTPSNTFVRPYFTHREDSSSVKLPSIFQGRNTHNASFSLTTSTANSSAQTSRDTSPFSFKRDPTFMALARRDSSPDGGKAKFSPRGEHEDLQRPGTQTSALLLPISSGADCKAGPKSKRKRKKMGGLLGGDGKSDAERLLREKLGAIEQRDSSALTSARGGEKTDLSETNFIDKVKDETTKALSEKTLSNNGARENKLGDNLATKPPIYQSTPTRIKTEKKVATVKA